MKRLDPKRRLLGRGGPRGYSASVDAARRATRARDHLERKRARERRRREREVSRSDRTPDRSPLRAAPSLLVFVGALLAGIFAATPLNQRSAFQATAFERVDVQGANILSPADIVKVAGLEERSSRDRFDVNAIIAAIEADPWIESARAMRLPTGALVISVVERDAIAIWQADDKSAPRLVDRRGERFDGAIEPGGPLPRVTGTGSSEAALPADAVEILGALARFASLTGDPRSLTLVLPSPDSGAAGQDADMRSGYVLQLGADGPRALLGRQLLSERVARLAALVETDEPTFLGARFIDLRYADRAVLRTDPVSG